MQNYDVDDNDDDDDDDDNDDDVIKICHIRPQSGTSSKLPRSFQWNFSPKNSENPNLKKSTNQKFWFCITIKRRFPTPITSVDYTETLLLKYWLEDFKLLFFNWLKE